MSEYQYYEFQAIDRPLTEAEMQQLRGYSSRASVTPTRFVVSYNWGSFKGDASAWMEKYFDAFLYLANWGTHELMLRLPRRLLDPPVAERYCSGEWASAHTAGDFVVLSFHSEDEEGDGWIEDDNGWLASILPVRADIAGGDLRALYLGWLLCAQVGEMDDEEPEPPVPPGLGKLTAALKALADFLRIDRDLLAVAAERSAAMEAEPAPEAYREWIAALPESEKSELLVRVASGGDGHVRTELLRRFRDSRRTDPTPQAESRTVGELLTAAEEHAQARERAEAERAARKRARQEREAAEARARYLDELATREEETWQRIDALVSTRKPGAYDEAAALVRDLQDLGRRDGRDAEVEGRVQALRERYARRSAFLARLGPAPGTLV